MEDAEVCVETPSSDNLLDKSLQVQQWPDPMLQLPALWPHMSPLQSACGAGVITATENIRSGTPRVSQAGATVS
jgi:hypothetical protein